jgi:hypothetical protein
MLLWAENNPNAYFVLNQEVLLTQLGIKVNLVNRASASNIYWVAEELLE